MQQVDKKLKHFKKIFGKDTKITPEYLAELKNKVDIDRKKFGPDYDTKDNYLLYEILDNKIIMFYL